MRAFDKNADARGMKIDEYDVIPGDVGRYACCGIVNRAASYASGRLFVGTLDGRLIAMDADSGETLWETTVVDYEQGSVITSPPTMIGNKVITGFGGGECRRCGEAEAVAGCQDHRCLPAEVDLHGLPGRLRGIALCVGPTS